MAQKKKDQATVDKLKFEIKKVEPLIRSEFKKENNFDFGEWKKEKEYFTIGLGKKKDFNSEKLRQISAIIAKNTKNEKLEEFSTDLHLKSILPLEKIGEVIAEGIILGTYKFDKYKKNKSESKIKKVIFADSNLKIETQLMKGINKGVNLANSVNYTRNLVNEPSNIATPDFIIKFAKKLQSSNTKVKDLRKKDLISNKLNGILAVAKGSSEEPGLLIIDYAPTKKKPIILVGKGVTFDSGGLSLKPANYMVNMKTDMAGAASIIGVIKALQKLNVQKRVIGILPLCENMTGSSAYKVDDIITAYNGKTIEIKNTDAEGRIILADALSFAEDKFNSKVIIDIATLTGASVIATGREITPIVGTDKKLIQKIINAGKESDEYILELPIIEEYKKIMDGEITDVVNIPADPVSPGVITGGVFLSHFVKNTPWAHLDIGGTGRAVNNSSYKTKGGTGTIVRTLIRFIEIYEV